MALQPLRILNDHKHEVCSVAFSPDGTTFASGGGYRDNAIRLWDARTWEPRGVLKGHKGKVSRLAFARDGRTLASAGHDRTVRLWDARTGEMRKTLAGCRTLVFAVAFAPDGKTLATAGQDGRVILWDADADGTCRTLTEHAGSALSVAFSEDGGMLASAGGMERWRGEPAEVRLWTTGDWRLNHVVGGHGDWVLWAAFSPDPEKIATTYRRRFGRWRLLNSADSSMLFPCSIPLGQPVSRTFWGRRCPSFGIGRCWLHWSNRPESEQHLWCLEHQASHIEMVASFRSSLNPSSNLQHGIDGTGDRHEGRDTQVVQQGPGRRCGPAARPVNDGRRARRGTRAGSCRPGPWCG